MYIVIVINIKIISKVYICPDMILKNDENNIVFGDTVTCDTLQ